MKKDVVEERIGEDLAEWLYADERIAGDKRTYSTDDYVYVIYVISSCYLIDLPLVDCRHILVSFEEVACELENTDGNTIDTGYDADVEVETAEIDGVEITNKDKGYSIDLVSEAYRQAKEIYDQYLEDPTEEYFSELAGEYTHDGNGDVGGLYENVEIGMMVAPFENWIYSDDRKVGDSDIIMTEYGWHIMYFVKQHDEPAWRAAARDILAEEKIEDYFEKVQEDIDELSEDYLDDDSFISGCEAAKEFLMEKYL